MSGDAWPEDPTDPRCPSCGEPVSATADYCMHCEVDLPSAGVDVAAGTTAVDGAPMDEADPGMPTVDETDRAAGRTAAAGAWIDPDSLLDDVSTAMVGTVGGLVAIPLVALVSYWLLPAAVEGAAFPLGLAAGAGGGLWVARTRTVFGAARKAGFGLGGLLALVPLSLGVALPWESAGDAVGGIFVFGVFLWPVAAALAGIGWVLGRGGVEGDG